MERRSIVGQSSVLGDRVQTNESMDRQHEIPEGTVERILIHQAMMNIVIQNHFLHNHFFQRDPPTDLEESTIHSLIFSGGPWLRFLETHKDHKSSIQTDSRKSRRPNTSCFTTIRRQHHETALGSGLLLGRRVFLFSEFRNRYFQICASPHFFIINERSRSEIRTYGAQQHLTCHSPTLASLGN